MSKQDDFDRYMDGDPEGMNRIYLRCREYTIGWLIKRFKCAREDAVDIYQTAFLIFLENVQSGKFTKVISSECTYLVEIAKRKCMEARRKGGNTDELPPDLDKIADKTDEPEEPRIPPDKLKKALKLLGDPCEKILDLYYFEGKSDKQIAEIMNYKNPETAKTMRHKCLERLRKLLFNSN